MKYLPKLLQSSEVFLDVEVSSKTGLFDQLAELLQGKTSIDAKQILSGLNEREQLCSTGIGMGVAIPHTRLKNLKDVAIVLLRLSNPLAYEAMDNQPVQIIFAIAIPQNANEEHLEILAEIADAFYDRETYQQIISANSSAQVLSILQQLV